MWKPKLENVPSAVCTELQICQFLSKGQEKIKRRVDWGQFVRSNGIKQLSEKVLPFGSLINKNIFIKRPAVAGTHLRTRGVQVTQICTSLRIPLVVANSFSAYGADD